MYSGFIFYKIPSFPINILDINSKLCYYNYTSIVHTFSITNLTLEAAYVHRETISGLNILTERYRRPKTGNDVRILVQIIDQNSCLEEKNERTWIREGLAGNHLSK